MNREEEKETRAKQSRAERSREKLTIIGRAMNNTMNSLSQGYNENEG